MDWRLLVECRARNATTNTPPTTRFPAKLFDTGIGSDGHPHCERTPQGQKSHNNVDQFSVPLKTVASGLLGHDLPREMNHAAIQVDARAEFRAVLPLPRVWDAARIHAGTRKVRSRLSESNTKGQPHSTKESRLRKASEIKKPITDAKAIDLEMNFPLHVRLSLS